MPACFSSVSRHRQLWSSSLAHSLKFSKSTEVQCQECINTPGENNMHICYCVLSAFSVLTKDRVHTKTPASVSLLDLFSFFFFLPHYQKNTPNVVSFLSPDTFKPSFLSPWHSFYPFISPDPAIRRAVMLSVVYRPPIFAPLCPAPPQSHDFSPSILLSLSFGSSHYRPQWVISPRSLLRSCHTTAYYHCKWVLHLSPRLFPLCLPLLLSPRVSPRWVTRCHSHTSFSWFVPSLPPSALPFSSSSQMLRPSHLQKWEPILDQVKKQKNKDLPENTSENIHWNGEEVELAIL